jgi:opacity protein-like surface antigen
LFLLAGGGLGYDSAGNRLKRDHSYLVGNQHFGGILQGGAGIYYNLGKRVALRVEYRFYHTSEPLRNDKGLNAHTALFGVSF